MWKAETPYQDKNDVINNLRRKHLLEKAQDALIRAEYLSFDLEVTAPPSIKVRAVTKMAAGKLFSEFYVKDGSRAEFREEKCIGRLLVTDGTAHEIRLNCLGIDRIVAIYPAPYNGGTYELFLDKGIEKYPCLIASAMRSWVGNESEEVRNHLPRVIMSGSLREDQTLEDGQHCHVIRCVRPNIERMDDYYIDSKTYLMVRWDTFYTDLGSQPILSRTRRYKNISIAPLPEDTWIVPHVDSQPHN